MAWRVLIVPDKFKGTLTAQEAAAAMAEGWGRARPQDTLELLPMSDGGDGFGAVLSQLLGAKPQQVNTVDAAHRPRAGTWWWDRTNNNAIIETAQVVGLTLLPLGRFHPFELDTFGLGALFESALQRGARKFLVGIGGSATNDAGFGLARSLGWKFFDGRGQTIERWIELDALARLDPPAGQGSWTDVRVAVDVQNPLLGAEGASRVYGPQKGLRSEDFGHAEACLSRLADLLKNTLGRDLAIVPGSGAAGGLGFGLACFLGAQLVPGFAIFAELAQLEGRIRRADLVLTGEGAIDRTTLMGKGVGAVAEVCRRTGMPCIGLAGQLVNQSGGELNLTQAGALGFSQIRAICPELAAPAQALTDAAFWLKELSAQVARQWSEIHL